MSSIAWNIKRKMEWMGRKLRKIDDPDELIKWAAALREFNSVLKELDEKEYQDNWKPWGDEGRQVKNGGKMDHGGSNDPFLYSRVRKNEHQVGLQESSGSDVLNIGKRRRILPPRVDVGGEEPELIAQKAAVMKMLEDDKVWQEENQKEKKEPLDDLSMEVMEYNREIWRKGMLEKLRNKKVPIEYWEDVGSGNFQGLIGFSAPHTVRNEVVVAMGREEADQWLYKEMKKFYATG